LHTGDKMLICAQAPCRLASLLVAVVCLLSELGQESAALSLVHSLHALHQRSRVQGNIEMKGVSFAYPARSDVPVLKSFDLSVTAGQTVALVGQSGSGKSTIIQLLERFYDPAAGLITVDGHDIRSLSLGWYRDHVGLVSQDPTLFATSIRENIAMGRAGATEKDIQEAAKAASAHNFISRLPQGYSTQVGEKGVQLSGGQKQRVAIARALLKNPSILLLDEATSALDTVSERLVQAALERLAQGRTTIVVAHRLSTIRNADKIAVVQV
jgi:ATP-binding cassette, subfamily B (MDR/TAP), member 1